MAQDFDQAFQIVVGVEKGYVVDSGGPTMYGITEAVARKHGYQDDVRQLPIETAKAIYLADYWLAVHCDELPWPISMLVFDSAVNQGPDPAIKMLQRALGVPQDGLLGVGSLAALKKLPAAETAALFLTYRVQRYQGTRGYDVDGKGWVKRLFIIAFQTA